jgi:hypothetical protein
MNRTPALRKLVSSIQILLLGSAASFAQTSQAAKIQQQVRKIGLQGNTTVYMPDGHEYYGSIGRIGRDDFAVNDVDLRREVTLRYVEVKKVRSGYGTIGRTITGKRVHPRKRLWVTLAVVGGLLTLVFVAVASDKS